MKRGKKQKQTILKVHVKQEESQQRSVNSMNNAHEETPVMCVANSIVWKQ